MMTWNETNAIEIQNEKGTLRIERDPAFGVRMTIHNEIIALTMTGLYRMEDVQHVIERRTYAHIKHGYFSASIGSKKVLETIFAREGTLEESPFSLTFLSEDTTYHYPMNADEWQEMMSLFAYLIETN